MVYFERKKERYSIANIILISNSENIHVYQHQHIGSIIYFSYSIRINLVLYEYQKVSFRHFGRNISREYRLNRKVYRKC